MVVPWVRGPFIWGLMRFDEGLFNRRPRLYHMTRCPHHRPSIISPNQVYSPEGTICPHSPCSLDAVMNRSRWNNQCLSSINLKVFVYPIIEGLDQNRATIYFDLTIICLSIRSLDIWIWIWLDRHHPTVLLFAVLVSYFDWWHNALWSNFRLGSGVLWQIVSIFLSIRHSDINAN